MKNILPSFNINVAYRSKKLANLLSGSLKQPISSFEQNNVIYKWQCPCTQSSYIGMTGRQLIERIQDHQRPSLESPIYMHFSTCTEYKKSFRKFQKDQGQKNATKTPVTNPVLKKQKFDFFKRQFTTLKKNFRSYFERRDAEAYFIRTLRPDLNGQNEHKFFKLF